MNRPAFPRAAALLALPIAVGVLSLAATLPAVAEPQRIVITAPGSAEDASPAQSVLDALASPVGFQMSNGRTISLQAQGEALRLRYGQRGAVTMRADGQNQFVSRDGQLVLTVAVDAFGDASTVRLSMPASWL